MGRKRRDGARSRRWLAALALAWAAPEATAFTVDDRAHVCLGAPCGEGGVVDVAATLAAASRWSATPGGAAPGLQGGIQVSIAPGFVEGLAPASERVPELRAAVEAAFRAWETPDLRFDLGWDVEGSEGARVGSELDLFLVDSSYGPFPGTSFTGVTFYSTEQRADRMLTNGALLPGRTIVGADIFIASDRFEELLGFMIGVGLATEADRAARLTNLVMHELGHALGLDHPNEYAHANFDDDGDPMTRVVVDPLAPFAGLVVSPNLDRDTVMRGGFPPGQRALFFDALRPDDLSGRDVLYPSLVPEPGSGLLVAAGLAGLASHARRRVRKR